MKMRCLFVLSLGFALAGPAILGLLGMLACAAIIALNVFGDDFWDGIG